MNTKTGGILSGKAIIVSILVVFLVILAVTPAVYFYNKYQKTQQLLKNPNQAAQQEFKSTLEMVGKLIVLPKDETPTLATVSDKSKLAKEPFFAHAENGDKVLIFSQAKKAILYRPSAHKIIEVAPLNVTSPEGTKKAEAYQVAIYNGSPIAGLATSIEKELTTNMSQLKVVRKDNASKKDYKKTVVVDITGKDPATATEIARLLGGEVNILPQSEKKPTDADFLIILGSTSEPTGQPG